MVKILKKLLFSKFFLLTLIVNGQVASRNLSFKAIDIKDGLSSYTVRKIIQDHYGFTWICTKDGLNRYDGKSFKVYNKGLKSTENIVGNDFWDMCEDTSRNLLWTISPYGSLNAIDLKNGAVVLGIPTDVTNKNFPNGWLRCLNICKGKIWIGTNDGLCVFNPEKNSFMQLEKVLHEKLKTIQNYSVDLIFADQFNRVWVFVKDVGLIIYSGETYNILETHFLSEFHSKDIIDLTDFNNSLLIDSSHLLVTSNSGFRMISYNKNKVSSIDYLNILSEKNFPDKNIISLTKDKPGNIWFATSANLYTYNFQSKQLLQIQSTINGAKNTFFDYVKSVYFDEKNYLWLGTAKELFFSTNTEPKFMPVYQTSDKKINIGDVYYIYPVSNDTIYTGTVNGLFRIDKNSISTIDTSKAFWYVKNIDSKRFLVSNQNGSFVLNENRKLIPAGLIFPELKQLQPLTINSGEQIGDSMIVFGTEKNHGIYIWNFHTHTINNITTTTIPLKLKDNDVNLVYKSLNGNIWILSNDNIGIFDPRTLTIKNLSWIDPSNNNSYSIFLDVCEANGYYWIAAYGTGIIQVDSNYHIKKIISGREGLPTTGIPAIESLNDSLIFTASNNGLFLLNAKTFVSRTFFESDGLSSSYNWNIAQKNGFIYVGGDKGITIINPGFFQKNSIVPKLYINKIKVETKTKSKSIDTSNLFFANYTVPNDFLQTTISFSAINYSNPSRTTYAYRIKGLDNNWIDLGTQNFVPLIGLPPGTYTLEVKAANEDGVWCEPKTLTLTFEPKWYQTWSFKILVFITALSLIYGFFRYRLMQIRKQHQIRKEIASDLHDDIGATINSVKIFAHLAETSPEKKKYFTHIKESLTQASVGLRDMIWVLDDTGDTTNDLLKRLSMFAHPVAEASNVNIHFNTDSDINIILNKTEKRNLLLIAKEAINNSIKYADCKNITVTFSTLHKKTTLTVQDDGKGFINDQVKHGNGLNNMQERAKQVHYKITVESAAGNGTKIMVVKK